MPFANITQIKNANRDYARRSGRAYWFAPDAMRFFNTEIVGSVRGGRYFITRDRMDETVPWGYHIRAANDDGSIETVSDFMQPSASFAEADEELSRILGSVPDSQAQAKKRRSKKRAAKKGAKKVAKRKPAKKKAAKKKATKRKVKKKAKKKTSTSYYLVSASTLKVLSRHGSRKLALEAMAKRRSKVAPLILSKRELEKYQEARPKRARKKATKKKATRRIYF